MEFGVGNVCMTRKLQQNQTVYTPTIASPKGPLGTEKEMLLAVPPWQVFSGWQCYWQILVRQLHILPFGVIIPTQCQSAAGSVFSLEAHVEKRFLLQKATEERGFCLLKGWFCNLSFSWKETKLVWPSITTVHQSAKHFTTDQDSVLRITSMAMVMEKHSYGSKIGTSKPLIHRNMFNHIHFKIFSINKTYWNAYKSYLIGFKIPFLYEFENLKRSKTGHNRWSCFCLHRNMLSWSCKTSELPLTCVLNETDL